MYEVEVKGSNLVGKIISQVRYSGNHIYLDVNENGRIYISKVTRDSNEPDTSDVYLLDFLLKENE